jgi:circadian clock protein KaiC
MLLPGCVGSGKTILSLQFIAIGAKKYHERGLYVTFEEREVKLREQAILFGWDFEALEKKKMVRLIRLPALTMGEMLTDLEKAIRSFKPQRLVIDSFTFMSLAAHTRSRVVDIDKIPVDELLYGEPKGTIVSAPLDWNTIVVKKMVTDLVLLLEQRNITTILTSEVSKNSDWYSRDTVSEFACDGVILLRSTPMGSELHRSIEIVKMRNAKIKGGIYSFDFAKNGIVVQE